MSMIATFALFPAVIFSYSSYYGLEAVPCSYGDFDPTYDGPKCAQEYIGLAQGHTDDVQSSIDLFTYLNDLPHGVSYNWLSFWGSQWPWSPLSEDAADCKAIGGIPDGSITTTSCLCGLLMRCWDTCHNKIAIIYQRQTGHNDFYENEEWELDASSSQCRRVLDELADTYGEAFCKHMDAYQFVVNCSINGIQGNTSPPSSAPTMFGQCFNGYSDSSYDGTKCANDYLALLDGHMDNSSTDFWAYLNDLPNVGAYNWYTFWEDQRSTVHDADCEAIAAIPAHKISAGNCLCRLRSVCVDYCPDTIQRIYIEQSGLFIVNNKASASSSVCNTVLDLLADAKVLCQDTEIYQAVVNCSNNQTTTTVLVKDDTRTRSASSTSNTSSRSSTSTSASKIGTHPNDDDDDDNNPSSEESVRDNGLSKSVHQLPNMWLDGVIILCFCFLF